MNDGRRANLSTALDLVLRGKAVTRAEIARQMSLTRASSSSLVSELISDDLVRELGPGRSNGGKPPTLLGFNRNSRDVVVLNLGGAMIHGAITDLTGAIRHQDQVYRSNLSGIEALNAALHLLEGLRGRAEAPILGVGVGTPGLVDHGGRVIEAVNLGWRNFDLGTKINQASDLPVTVGNDAQMAALTACSESVGGGRNSLLLMLGQGIGAGVVLGGRIHRGEHFAAGEIGHVQIDPDGARCRCGNNGCLETIASVGAIAERLGIDPRLMGPDPSNTEPILVDAQAKSTLRDVGFSVGTVLAYAIALLDISHVVICTQFTLGQNEILEGARAAIRERLMTTVAGNVTMTAMANANQLVLSGAARSVIIEQLGVRVL